MRKEMLVMMLLATLLVLTSGAYATTISVGLQLNGIPPTPTTVATSSTGTLVFGPIGDGTFGFISGSADDETVLGAPGLLDSQTLGVSGSAAGVLNVFFTVQGLSATGVQHFLSSFAVNSLTGSTIQVTESTFFSPTNALYTGTLLDTHTFSAIGTSGPTSATGTVSGTYSVTEQYNIVDFGGRSGSNNLTIDLSGTTVPEPTSLGLLGVGLLGIAMKLRR